MKRQIKHNSRSASRLTSLSLSSRDLQITVAKNELPDSLIKANSALAAGDHLNAINILHTQALADVENILRKDPLRTDVMFVLAMIYRQLQQFEQAEQWYNKILKIESHPLILNELGFISRAQGHFTKALDYRRRALCGDPHNAEILANLASDMINSGQKQKGVRILKKTAKKLDCHPYIHSSYLLNIHYLNELDQDLIFEEHKNWAKIHTPTRLAQKEHKNSHNPERKLRIGYVSGDFRNHSVAYFFESILDGHDSQNFETYGYANLKCPDRTTERLKTKFDHYKNICGADDKSVADIIRHDKIDILVDLAGHTAGNRLSLFARKPAPIQVTYLGYPDTTGMEAIDYRITDPLADLPDAQNYYTEKLLNLPDSFLCYTPPGNAPPVSPLPAKKNGFITFGSFNNNCKLNPFIINIWSQILRASPTSRLILKFIGGDETDLADHYLKIFEQNGIERNRVTIYGSLPNYEHLKLYEKIDIALDTYPYNGTTTTCQAMWMGVPTLSFTGSHHASRVGLSLITRVGLEIFTASTPGEYIAKALSFAGQPQNLSDIRKKLRNMMLNSPICDPASFAKNLENAYREIWKEWCDSKKQPQKKRFDSNVPDSKQFGLFKILSNTKLALQNDPENPQLLYDYARTQMVVDQTKLALDNFKKAAKIAPDKPAIFSDYLLGLHYLPGIDRNKIFSEHKKWAKIHAPEHRIRTLHRRDRDPNRTLRIGYISPDFKMHPVAFFFESLLDGRNSKNFELFGYGDIENPDQVTERIKNKFDHYNDIRNLNDATVCDMIEQHKIDILIDLAGHTVGNRLGVLSHKPAPIAVTYLGFPGTTGMKAIDYRFTDSIVDPPGSQKYYCEKLVSLPDSFACYRPVNFAPLPSPLPAIENGFITFGSFNGNCKISSVTLKLWAEVLKHIDKSRLLLRFKRGKDPGLVEHYLKKFDQLGISPQRIEISGWQTYLEHLKAYSRVDIALDTYSWNGHTTSCEALWMGVPVITLTGNTFTSRLSLTLLKQLDMQFLAASTPRHFLQIALTLSANLETLSKIRLSLRHRFAASPLYDAKRFANAVETEFRKMWQKYCRTKRAADISQLSLDNIKQNICSQTRSEFITRKDN